MQLVTSKGLLWSTVLLILMTVRHVVSAVCTPMFLAQNTVLCFWVLLLWDMLRERDHLPLVGVSLIGLALLVLLLVFRKGLLNAFESFEKLKYTLRYHILGEFILGLPSTWAHMKDVTH